MFFLKKRKPARDGRTTPSFNLPQRYSSVALPGKLSWAFRPKTKVFRLGSNPSFLAPNEPYGPGRRTLAVYPGSIPHLIEKSKTRDEKVLLTLQLTVQNPIADTVTIYMEPVG